MPDISAKTRTATAALAPSATRSVVNSEKTEKTIVNKIEMPIIVHSNLEHRQDARSVGREIGQRAAQEMRRKGLKV